MRELFKEFEKAEKTFKKQAFEKLGELEQKIIHKCDECKRPDVSQIEYDGWEKKFAYSIAHTPIDETRDANGEWTSPIEDEFWGINKVFKPLQKDDSDYKLLFAHFSFDEPAFIGKCVIPYATELELIAEYVYVVRCWNNGTTYFVAARPEVLRGFCGNAHA